MSIFGNQFISEFKATLMIIRGESLGYRIIKTIFLKKYHVRQSTHCISLPICTYTPILYEVVKKCSPSSPRQCSPSSPKKCSPISKVVLSNVILSNVVLSNEVLSNVVLSNVVLSN